MSLGIWLLSAALSTSNGADIIKIDNVCLKKQDHIQYDVASVVDFQLIEAYKNNETIYIIYVGYNPQLEGENRNYDPAAYKPKHKGGDIIRLTGPQAGDILGVPFNRDDSYYHIHFYDVKFSKNQTKPKVYFC